MDSFEQTPEYQQMLKMRNACNNVICDWLGVEPGKISRFNVTEEKHILDKEFHIDLTVQLPNGSNLNGQEKALSNEFYRYRTFTIEFYQNRYTKEPGEFFHIASQFYLHGYSNHSGVEFAECKIIDLAQLLIWLKDAPVHKLERRTKPSGNSRASFLPIPYDKIPPQMILYDTFGRQLNLSVA